MGGELGGWDEVTTAGRLAQGLALALFIAALGIVAPRRPLPRRQARPLADPLYLHALAAYLWLGSASLALIAGAAGIPLRADLEAHLLGAGFITPLILGVGARLLPGFAGRPAQGGALLWPILALANAAALLRVGPLLLAAALPASVAGTALALAGVCGLVAVALFGLHLAGGGRPHRSGS